MEATFYGFTGAQGSGAVIARDVARAFESFPEFRRVESGALRRIMQADGLSIRELASLDPASACALGLRLEADMVVVGRVLACRTAWVLFVPRTTVGLELHGLDCRSGTRIWFARAERSGLLAAERKLTYAMCLDVASAIRKEVCSPETSGSL